MDTINLDGEYYGNFDTYFKIEGDKMEVYCYLLDQVLKYNYKRIKNEFISIENENDKFEIFSYTKDSIIMKESTEMIIEIKRYTIFHKLIQLLGYKI